MNMREKYISTLDMQEAYRFAKEMEKYRTNERLGYRTAGSEAELMTGVLIYKYMEDIGLSDVTKDAFTLDSWTFEKAQLYFTDDERNEYCFELGAYQTDFVTDGIEPFELVHAGRGRAEDYEGLDVTGKLVLVDINQRDEWWINFPVYEAKLKGARAVIAVQDGGYGEIDRASLNAQDIAGPKDAPAFSISKNDACILLEALRDKKIVNVRFDAKSVVHENMVSYNITGKIPGKNSERMILLSAHYDSYFDGFQDDNTAVAMILNIARTMLICGYEPENTIVVCAMAAEEWGAVDSKYDWSTGAYEQFFNVHPEWQGKVIADLNFELPALAHGTADAVRSTYEYERFLNHFIDGLPKLTEAYEGRVKVLTPIETWSDDFSAAISGIPSFVNDFSGGDFMETHYHSQFDNDTSYDAAVYRFHHEFYGLFLMALDKTVIVPLDFSNLFVHAEKTVDDKMCRLCDADGQGLRVKLDKAKALADKIYSRIEMINSYDETRNRRADAKEAFDDRKLSAAEAKLLFAFKKCQNKFVRLTWMDDVIFPHEASMNNICHLSKAKACLEAGNISEALGQIYEIDNNQYAFSFDKAVYTHFTDYVLNQPKERLRWGWQRIIHHENLYDLVEKLKEKLAKGSRDMSEEILFLQSALERQIEFFRDDIEYMKQSADDVTELLSEAERLLG
mgnify:FL=1